MALVNYVPFVDRMITKYEGSYGWDAGDPGGPTKYGITCWDLAEHRDEKMTSMAAWAPLVRAMPLSEAEEIYDSKYAVAVQFDALNSGPDCAIFDFDVNSGDWGIKFAQRVAGVEQDGVLGPVSLAAINAMDPKTFVVVLCGLRLAFLHELRTWGRFGVGWTNRVNDLRVYCLELVANTIVSKGVAMPVSFLDTSTETFCDKDYLIPYAFAKSHAPE